MDSLNNKKEDLMANLLSAIIEWEQIKLTIEEQELAAKNIFSDLFAKVDGLPFAVNEETIIDFCKTEIIPELNEWDEATPHVKSLVLSYCKLLDFGTFAKKIQGGDLIINVEVVELYKKWMDAVDNDLSDSLMELLDIEKRIANILEKSELYGNNNVVRVAIKKNVYKFVKNGFMGENGELIMYPYPYC